MNETLILLLVTLAIAFYNVGTIWAMEVDIFRTWRLVDRASFHAVQAVHWRKLPYWIFTPVGLNLIASILLVWNHPPNSPAWGLWGSLGAQILSHILTASFWGRWQAALSKDPKGPQSIYLAKILRTHWVRTLLITANGVILLLWTINVLG